MSIRCSLLGHSYGDAEIEREREEQGSEVVVTVREFEECERCGDRKIITENKEVTALQSPAPDLESAESDSAADATTASAGGTASTGGTDGTDPTDGADASASSDASTTSDATGGPTASEEDADVQLGADAEVAGDDAEIIGGSSESTESSESAEASESAKASGSAEASQPNTSPDSSGVGGSDTGENDMEQSPSAADDDGVILDDGNSSAGGDDDRTPGEWPDAETTHPTEADHGPGDWPAVGSEDGDDEGYDAEPAEAGSADVEFGGSLTPESADVDDDETDEVEFVNAEGDALRSRNDGTSGPELSSGISAGADAPSLSGPADDPGVDAEFICPECDYREGIAGSSLRAGDICPECSRGYLAQE